jgi:rare lipoprotein A
MKKLLISILGLILCIKSAEAFDQKKINRIFQKNYQKYFELDDYNAEGKALVYSDKFHQRKTASSIKHIKTGFTAASVKLPLMSVVTVTNKRTGKSISVLINDRGPFKTNAILDLSKSAAKALALHSSDNVVVEFDLQKTLGIIEDTKNLKKFGI